MVVAVVAALMQNAADMKSKLLRNIGGTECTNLAKII